MLAKVIASTVVARHTMVKMQLMMVLPTTLWSPMSMTRPTGLRLTMTTPCTTTTTLTSRRTGKLAMSLIKKLATMVMNLLLTLLLKLKPMMKPTRLTWTPERGSVTSSWQGVSFQLSLWLMLKRTSHLGCHLPPLLRLLAVERAKAPRAQRAKARAKARMLSDTLQGIPRKLTHVGEHTPLWRQHACDVANKDTPRTTALNQDRRLRALQRSVPHLRKALRLTVMEKLAW